MALDAHAHAIQNTDGYMKYIAARPRVERHGEPLLGQNNPSPGMTMQ